jgi:hypothetical protein
MKNRFLGAFPLGRVALLLVFATLTGRCAQTNELKFEAQLIWATNDEKSPNPKHKDVEPEIRKKLDELPLKWKNYFEVNRKRFSIVKGTANKVSMSEKCGIDVKDVDGKKVEVSLINKGEAVWTRTQPLPRGEILILSGNAPDKTAWLITLKRIE